MADVRELLRAERKSRRITHPQASYTSAGNLLCNLCEIPIKSEAAWNSHLSSTQHTLRLSRAQDAAATRKQQPNAGQKRKADDPEASPGEDRKRVKSTEIKAARPNTEQDDDGIDAQVAAPQDAPVEAQLAEETMDDSELLALEADLAALERETRAAPNTAASAIISAPAISAEELAAQAREEQSAQRGRRDAEIEDEKEDAARALEDEFAEMESLEERVKRLTERREALREIEEKPGGDLKGTGRNVEAADGTVGEEEIEDDEEDDEEDFDGWNFGAR